MAIYHVSTKWGSNDNDGLTKETAFLTIGYAMSLATYLSTIYVHEGKYIESDISVTSINIAVTGIGKVILDGSIINQIFVLSSNQSVLLRNIEFNDYNIFQISSDKLGEITDCYMYNIGASFIAGGSSSNVGDVYDTVFNTNKIFSLKKSNNLPVNSLKNNTFTGSGLYEIAVTDDVMVTNYINNIWHTTNVELYNINACKLKYNHFYSTGIDILDGLGLINYDDSIYTLNDLRQRAVNFYDGVLADYFPNCEVYDATTTDCFIDESLNVKEGFYLKATSPSATANYITGKYIGGLPVAKSNPFSLTNYTTTNLDANGELIDTSINATLEYTNVFDNGKVVLVEAWGVGVIEAMRNGEYVNIDKDTSNTSIINGGTLVNDLIYVCENESLTVTDGTTSTPIAVGENYKVPSTETWTISSTTGVMRELYTDKQPVIEVKHSKTDTLLTTASYLRYYVYPLDDDGVTATYPMCNLDASGDPLYGDADTLFDINTAVRVALRYEKKNITIQVNNSKS